MVVETLTETRPGADKKFFHEVESQKTSNEGNMYDRALLRSSHLCQLNTTDSLNKRVATIRWPRSTDYLDFMEFYGAEVQDLDILRYKYNLENDIVCTKSTSFLE